MTTGRRTGEAIERQEGLMGRTPTDYLRHIIASTFASHNEGTVLADDGRILWGLGAYDRDRMFFLAVR
jgi:hypothetical protein